MAELSLIEINEMVLSAYDRIADSYTGAYAENDDMDAKYLDEFISRIDVGKVLDMGSGTGTNTQYLAQKGFDVIGIDASKNMLTVARTLHPTRRFEEQNILHTSYATPEFDGIVLAYVVNHFNHEGLLCLKQEIDHILKDGGLLFISAHMGDSEEVVPDPLDASIRIYYNFLSKKILDSLFGDYICEYYAMRPSYGVEEFLCDKMFLVYRRRANEHPFS
jgi:SAM-dependent methyltransferase